MPHALRLHWCTLSSISLMEPSTCILSPCTSPSSSSTNLEVCEGGRGGGRKGGKKGREEGEKGEEEEKEVGRKEV